MRKAVEKALQFMESKRLAKRGNILVGIAQGVAGFAIALIAVVLVAVIVAALQSSSGITAGTTAYTVANNTLNMLANFSAQLGLAGTVLGFVVIFGGLALLGVYAYSSYKGSNR